MLDLDSIVFEVTMPVIGITASDERVAQRYVEAVLGDSIDIRLFVTGKAAPPNEVIPALDGLLLTGGPDIEPSRYSAAVDPNANVRSRPERDAFELPLLRRALEVDLPVLAICRGMQALNVVSGGKLIQDFPNHRAVEADGQFKGAQHRIWISPGSKLAASIGSGGTVHVNSRHHQGLREAQKAPTLRASAYALDDSIIEGLESPDHTWVVGVQFHPEIAEEVPKQFAGLFGAFVYFAQKRAATRAMAR